MIDIIEINGFRILGLLFCSVQLVNLLTFKLLVDTFL